MLTDQNGGPPPKLVVYGNSNVTANIDIVNSGISIYDPVSTIEVIGSPNCM